MNSNVNEVMAAKATEKPGLISAPVKELLNLRRLPAMLNSAQTAGLMGLAEHDIPVLVSAGLLKPLGNPPPNAVKSFASVEVMELAGEIARLSQIRNRVYEYWHNKNAGKSRATRSRHLRNGHG